MSKRDFYFCIKFEASFLETADRFERFLDREKGHSYTTNVLESE